MEHGGAAHACAATALLGQGRPAPAAAALSMKKRQREAFGFSHMKKIPQRQVAAAEFLLYGGKRRDSGEGTGNC